MNIDMNSPVPLYYQLSRAIRDKIEDGEYQVDDKIPSERQLSEELNLSRMTVSKAIDSLVDDGLLVRKRGRGTFVARRKIEFFPGLLGFTKMIRDMGMKPSSKVLEKKIIEADEFLAEILNLKVGDRVISIKRIRLANDEAVNLEKEYLSYEHFSDLLERDLENTSYYAYFNEIGMHPTSARQEVNAVLSGEGLAELLDMDVGDAVLKRNRVTYSGDRPIEYSINYYKGDFYTMVIEVGDR